MLFVNGLKPCTDCGRELPEDAFYKNRHALSGHTVNCKECRKKRMQGPVDTAARKRWRENNRQHNRDYQRHRYIETQRKRNLMKLYGLTVEQYDEMVRRQNGACAICKEPPSDNRRLAVDHDHDTGVVRGLLCTNCNAGIGLLGDSPDRLLQAITYLEKGN